MGAVAAAVQPWPSSVTADALDQRASTRARTVALALVRNHAGRQLAAGWRGAAAVGALVFVILRVGIAALVRVGVRSSAKLADMVLPKPVSAAALSCTMCAASLVGRDLLALGASLEKLADELSSDTINGHTKSGEQRAA